MRSLFAQAPGRSRQHQGDLPNDFQELRGGFRFARACSDGKLRQRQIRAPASDFPPQIRQLCRAQSSARGSSWDGKYLACAQAQLLAATVLVRMWPARPRVRVILVNNPDATAELALEKPADREARTRHDIFGA